MCKSNILNLDEVFFKLLVEETFLLKEIGLEEINIGNYIVIERII